MDQLFLFFFLLEVVLFIVLWISGNKRCAFSNAFNIVFERANVEAEMHPELFPCSFGFIDCPHNPRICKFFNVTNTPKVL